MGVVGCGPLVGLPHARRIVALEGAVLAAVCSLRPGPAMAEFGVPGYTDPAAMVAKEGLHAAVISTPTHLHLPTLKALLTKTDGKNPLRAILVEKPICESVASAEEFLSVADEAGVKVLVGHQRRHSAAVKGARKIVRNEQTLGPLRGVACQWALLKPASYFNTTNPNRAYIGQKGKGGPVLINMVHDLDLIRFITGREIVRVFASTAGLARDNEAEDTGVVTLELDNGAQCSVFFSDAAPSPWNYEFTTGENKKYPPLPDAAGTPDCYQFFGGHASLGFPSLRTFGYLGLPEGAEPGWDAALTVNRDGAEATDPLAAQMAHFLRVCNGIEEPLCSGHDGLTSLLVVSAVQQSADTGLPVEPSSFLVKKAGPQCVSGVMRAIKMHLKLWM